MYCALMIILFDWQKFCDDVTSHHVATESVLRALAHLSSHTVILVPEPITSHRDKLKYVQHTTSLIRSEFFVVNCTPYLILIPF